MNMSIILAAGEGTRMKSYLPKTLHKVCGKEMIKYVIESSNDADIKKNVVVLGHGKEEILKNINGYDVITVEQPIGGDSPYGTGYAVIMAKPFIEDEDDVLILCADGPLITKDTLKNFMIYHQTNKFVASVLTAYLETPKGYGRIIKNEENCIVNIVEEKDADEVQKNIKEINTGIYCFKGKYLKLALDQLDTNNSQNEFYLTDTIRILSDKGLNIGGYVILDESEIKAVNDRVQLAEVNKIMQKRINEKHMRNGVTIINPENTYIEDDVIIGCDTIIYPGAFLENKTCIGESCIIGPNTRIINSKIENFVEIESSKIIESYVDEKTKIGPFAYLRPGTKLGKNVKIGDFVEVKKSTIGDNSKSSHLSYIGDAQVGKNVNIGCGVVFVNYDGKNKNKVVVGDNSFVGSNSNLVAPVNLENESFVACGSTITEDVNSGDLAIARARQINKKGLGKNRY